MAKNYVLTAFGYAIIGMMLGIYMAASNNHSQFVTHAHILLVGFVVSFVYAACYKIWELDLSSRLVKAQFASHQAGALTMVVGLFLLYGGLVSAEILEPILALASIAVLAAMIMMTIQFLRHSADLKSPARTAAADAVTGG